MTKPTLQKRLKLPSTLVVVNDMEFALEAKSSSRVTDDDADR